MALSLGCGFWLKMSSLVSSVVALLRMSFAIPNLAFRTWPWKLLVGFITFVWNLVIRFQPVPCISYHPEIYYG